MQILHGIDVHSRERVWVDGDPELAREFFAEVKQTAAGKKYFRDFASPENNELVIEAVWRLYPDIEYVTVSTFVDAIGTMIAAGELTPTHTPEPAQVVEPPAPVPVDRNGRPLTQAQLDWSEMTAFTNERSMKEINDRKRVDPKFLAYIQTNLRRQMDQPIDGDARPTNPHLEQNAAPTKAAMKDERLVKFASDYRKAPTAEIKKLKRLDTNPLGATQFNKDEADCFRLGLL